MSTKWTYHEEQSFANNYLIFWRLCFSLKTSYKELIWCTKNLNAHIPTFHKHWSFCKNRLYKTNEAEIGEKIKTNLEHFEAGKCKDKNNKNDE